MWQRTKVSKLWLCVNSRYILRLWHSTRQKAYSLRGAPLYSSAPKCPQSTSKRSPGAGSMRT